METSESFDEAVAVLSTRKVISGAYFIIGGTKSGEGVVVSRDSDGLAGSNLWMNSTDPKWYWARLFYFFIQFFFLLQVRFANKLRSLERSAFY